MKTYFLLFIFLVTSLAAQQANQLKGVINEEMDQLEELQDLDLLPDSPEMDIPVEDLNPVLSDDPAEAESSFETLEIDDPEKPVPSLSQGFIPLYKPGELRIELDPVKLQRGFLDIPWGTGRADCSRMLTDRNAAPFKNDSYLLMMDRDSVILKPLFENDSFRSVVLRLKMAPPLNDLPQDTLFRELLDVCTSLYGDSAEIRIVEFDPKFSRTGYTPGNAYSWQKKHIRITLESVKGPVKDLTLTLRNTSGPESSTLKKRLKEIFP